MLLYHGSSKKFDKFDIKKCSDSKHLKEGKGIYMTDSKNIKVAKAYGKYLYTVDIPDSKILDFTKKSTLKSFLSKVAKPTNVISREDMANVVEGMQLGEVAIFNHPPEICQFMDSAELWELYPDKAEDILGKAEKVYFSMLEKYQAIKYNDKELGVVYFAKYNVDKLKIVNCEQQN